MELLPDRQAETLATWLRQHPGIEIVARDRAGAYADGICQGAPGAIQVSGRWHLLRNLGDAVRAVIDRHHGAIQRAAKQHNQPHAEPANDTGALPPIAPKVTTAQRRSQDAYGRRRSRYEDAARLRAAGVSISTIATTLGAERKTIRRWLRAGGAPLWSKPARTGILKPYQAHLERHWAEGCHNEGQVNRLKLLKRTMYGRAGFQLLRARVLQAA